MVRDYGDWQVVEELGRGGMGVVWRCVHRETGVDAAVKVLEARPGGSSESLRREIFALSRVQHPQIVRILDHGETAGTPWYAMELVEGEPLSRHLGASRSTPTFSFDAAHDPLAEERNRAETPLHEALTILAHLCPPLAALHSAGLVHRDLKAGNVVLRADGLPVLIDFGLATPTKGRTGLVGTDATTGTPASAAPEQVRGELADARTDLYALGCLAFELLAGRGPFVGPFDRLLRAHLIEPPPRVRELRPDVPRAVDDLVDALLSKDPRDRPPHALDVLDRLVSAGAAPPSRPGPPPHVYRPRIAGRADTLDTVSRCIEDGRAAWLVARSGVGKTRLLLEVARRARQRGAEVVLGEARADGGSVLDSLLTQLGRMSEQQHGVRWWGAWGPLLARMAPSLRGVAGVALEPAPAELEFGPALQRLAVAVADVMLRAAADRPLMLLVDDLHWADAAARAALRLLALRADEAPIQLVAAWRIEEQDADLESLRALGEVVELPELSRAEVSEIASDMLAAPAPAGLVEYLVTASRGSPLWVTEMVASLVERGEILRTAAGWRVPAPLPPAPSSLDALVTGRLDDLSRTPSTRTRTGTSISTPWADIGRVQASWSSPPGRGRTPRGGPSPIPRKRCGCGKRPSRSTSHPPRRRRRDGSSS